MAGGIIVDLDRDLDSDESHIFSDSESSATDDPTSKTF
jgi:hypothetical protein